MDFPEPRFLPRHAEKKRPTSAFCTDFSLRGKPEATETDSRHAPWQRPAVVQIEHLVGVEQLAEARDELQPLTASRLDVDEHQQRLHAVRHHGRLHVGQEHHCNRSEA